IIVHAAKRHDAESVEHLTKLTGSRIGYIGAIAADFRPVAFS
ncbi:MAG: hypothetical protein QOI02_1060, partial [Actinomycetota bacterium]|nr:hypothetical protein [Actinomycetota bacterium]